MLHKYNEKYIISTSQYLYYSSKTFIHTGLYADDEFLVGPNFWALNDAKSFRVTFIKPSIGRL